jgi:hypothetical protein
MAGKAAVDVQGLKEFRKELKAVDAGWPKVMQKLQKQLASDVADRARGVASGMGGVQAKAAGSIKGYATATSTSVGAPSGGIAGAAFWGTLRHTGWYAAARYSASPRQHPVWVGNSWEPGVSGQGPYAINDTIADMLSEIDEWYLDMVTDLTAAAFPD